MKLPAYPKIQTLGHRTIKNIFEDEVEITEKIDGSQFKFGLIEGDLHCESKGAVMNIYQPPKIFAAAVSHVRAIQGVLLDNVTYYSETLHRPKHNVLAYNNIPKNHIMLFGMMKNDLHEMYSFNDIIVASQDLNVEHVPLLARGKFNSTDLLVDLLSKESSLGGPNIEGIVVKNYKKDGMIGDVYLPYLVGKFVSESFKEKHAHNKYGRAADNQNMDAYMNSFNTEARFNKAVQHLREDGLLIHEPKDIGPLMKELNMDFLKECEQEIKDWLWNYYRKKALHRMSRGFPEWYKTLLMKGEDGD